MQLPTVISWQHYINAVIPNTGTAISSFRLDGFPVSSLSLVYIRRTLLFLILILSTGGGHRIFLNQILGLMQLHMDLGPQNHMVIMPVQILKTFFSTYRFKINMAQ